MLHEVDEALRTLVRRDALNGTDVEVLFDAPTKEWAARRNSPTVDIYLYDIREDLKWRAYGSVDVRNQEGFIAARQGPPRYFKLSYLVTAWTQRPEDEHRLLSAVLYCFLRFDALPADVLTGVLADQRVPVRTTIAQPPPEDRALSDTWSALGGELKPSLDLIVTAAIDARGLAAVAPLVLEEPRLTMTRPEGVAEEATVGPGHRGRPQHGGHGAEPLPEETVGAGKEGGPGRVLRIRAKTEP